MTEQALRTINTKPKGLSAPVAPPPWKNRIVGSGEERPDQLLSNPANWRVHPKNQQAALAGSLDTVGWVQQVLVNKGTGYVVDGHARVALALDRNEETVPVLYVELSEDEERTVLATFDPIGAMATADKARLEALLTDLMPADAGLQALLDDLAETNGIDGLIAEIRSYELVGGDHAAELDGYPYAERGYPMGA